MSAKVIEPIVITPAMVTSSTATEAAPALYSGGTTYAINALVGVAGSAGTVSVYQSLQNSNTGHTPSSSGTWWAYQCDVYQTYSGAATYAEKDRVQDNTAHLVYESLVAGNMGNALTDTTKWIKVGSTQKYAMFDDVVGTSTRAGTDLTAVLSAGSVSGLALLELSGTGLVVTVKDAPGGSVVYTRSVGLDGSLITTVFDWFFSPIEQRTDVVFTDLPGQYYGAEITIQITGFGSGCGVCSLGTSHELGDVKTGASVGILDFSTKERDRWGKLTVKPGEFSKRASLQMLTSRSDFNRIYRRLASLRAKPAVYVGTESPGFDPLIVFGVYKDFSIVIEYRDNHLCSLEIEGLI